jgi:hypothetical protein
MTDIILTDLKYDGHIYDGVQPFLLGSMGNFFSKFGQKIKIKIVLDSQ